jgi:hypothetical protein
MLRNGSLELVRSDLELARSYLEPEHKIISGAGKIVSGNGKIISGASTYVGQYLEPLYHRSGALYITNLELFRSQIWSWWDQILSW